MQTDRNQPRSTIVAFFGVGEDASLIKGDHYNHFADITAGSYEE
jgi:hypothetical protein